MTTHVEARIVQNRLADFTRDKRILVLAAMAVVIGVISAVIAYILIELIALFTNLAFYQRFSFAEATPAGHHLGAWVVVVPVVGGVVIGLMARYGSPKIRGHGIPEALEAILIGRSKLDPKVAVLKPLSSAVSIGTGGPFGAEGPIIMTGGAFGSLFAQLFNLSAAERKTLLVAGAAGGMAAVFATPVAAVLLAVELLLFEWRPRSFIPVTLSATIASLVRVPLLGGGPLFPTIPHATISATVILIALALGLVGGLGALAATGLVYTFEDLFHRLPIHWMWWPALGGLLVGIGGYFDPRVLGVGYELIERLIRGEMIGSVVIGLLVIKALVWAVALGSGTSGGVLAPLLIIGAALGAFGAGLFPNQDAGLWAMICMTAFMGGTMRAPLTAMIFTVELTHDFNALPALMAATVVAYGMTVLMMRRSILTEKVARRGLHLMREYSVDPFMLVCVGDIMDREMGIVPADMTVADLSMHIADGDPLLTRHQAQAIVDEEYKLVGIVTRGDVVRALSKDSTGQMTVLEAGSANPCVTYPDELVDNALAQMLQYNVGRLLVVSRENPRRLVGYLGRSTILNARKNRIEEEFVREPGVLQLP